MISIMSIMALEEEGLEIERESSGENMEINILILSAGRRVELVNCFKKAAKKLNIKKAILKELKKGRNKKVKRWA